MEPKLIKGDFSGDDRGFVHFLNEFNPAAHGIKRFYIVENHQPRFVRAWHGHQNEGKYLISVSGDFLIGVAPLDTKPRHELNRVKKFLLSSKRSDVLYIPPGYYNGLMNIQAGARLMIFSTSTVEESLNDDKRLEWDCWNIWKADSYR